MAADWGAKVNLVRDGREDGQPHQSFEAMRIAAPAVKCTCVLLPLVILVLLLVLLLILLLPLLRLLLVLLVLNLRLAKYG